MDILVILSLPTHKNGVFLCLCKLSLFLMTFFFLSLFCFFLFLILAAPRDLQSWFPDQGLNLGSVCERAKS